MHIVSSFNKEGYEKYAKRFLESFIANWPKKVKLIVYYHDFELADAPAAPNVEYRNLNKEFPALEEWRNKYKHATGNVQGRYDYRYDGIKFSHKVFAISDVVAKLRKIKRPGQLIWLDADTITTQQVSPQNIIFHLPKEADIIHLGRRTINYSETSFISFNLNRPQAWQFLADFRDCYTTGEIFSYAEWHDGFIFERLLNVHKWHGLKALSLSDPQDLDAFNSSPLGSFMQHFKGAKKETPNEIPVKIFPVNAAADKVILGNVQKNVKLLKKWLPRYKQHDSIAVMLSGGPSLEKHIPEIKQFVQDNPNSKIFCVKHSLPTLIKNGIVPWACVLLDARPFKGVSTHGFKRAKLLAESPKETNYFMASMVDPAAVKFLQKRGRNVVGWHAYTQGLEKTKIGKDAFFVIGGTCAAVRMISLAHVMGFKKFHLWGYDSCLYEQPDLRKKDEKGRPMYVRGGVKNTGQSWWTTGELMSQAQDLETLWKTASEDMNLNMHGDGLGPLMVAQVERPLPNDNLPTFEGTV